MNNVLVMHQNYVSSDILTSQTKSSELAAAPATNIYDKVRRTKVWRSQGYWEVTSSINQIIFQETVGVNLTASIVVSNYATDTTFLAAIKTAMQAVGASTYTVARDTTTNKIKITSSGTGGGGIFRLILSNVGFTAKSTIGFTTGSDLTGALNYTADTLRIHTSEWVRWDFGTAVLPKVFAITGTLKDGLKISSTATVTLQGNSTDVWTSPQYSQAITWNTDCMSLIDTSGLGGTALRYWRLLIVDTGNTNGYVEISNAYLGGAITQTTGSVKFPLEIGYLDYATSMQGEWGTHFASKRQTTRQFRLNWEYLTKSEVEDLYDFVEIYGTSDCFWIALDPNGVYSSFFQKFVCMCYFDEMPKFTLDRPNQLSSLWAIREAV